MNILHISGANSKSGAGGAALITHNALLELGVKSKILFLAEENSINDNIISYQSISIVNKIKRKIVSLLERSPTWFYRNKGKQLFSTALFGLSLKSLEIFKWADIIHIHWANHGFIDIAEMAKWNKPIIWTLRDMWAFTGGCHYSFECTKYIQTCGSCPSLKSKKSNDLSTLVFRRKKKYLSKANIHWVAISNWMKRRAEESSICNGSSIPVIFSGIDTKIFHNLNSAEVRHYFNLPLNKKIILIGAADLTENYKGIDFITSVLKQISSDYVIATFGRGEINSKIFAQQIFNFGYIESAIELNKLYNVADLFFAPSIAEAFGKTIAEAQSCGVPVVGFRNTGPEDIVEHLKTGYLANYKDGNDLLKGLLYCLDNSFDKGYIRERARRLFDINVIAEKYIELYDKCVADADKE